MEYEITLKIRVDPDANYLEVGGNNCQVIKEQITDALYDIDDLQILDIDVTLLPIINKN